MNSVCLPLVRASILAVLRLSGSVFGLSVAVLGGCGDVRGQGIVESASTPQPNSSASTNSSEPSSGSLAVPTSPGTGGTFNTRPSWERGGAGHDNFPHASAASSGMDSGARAIQICRDCREHRDCPRNDSLCIRDPANATGFCGFACARGECPTGHACFALPGPTAPQCVPLAGTCTLPSTGWFSTLASPEEMRSYNLSLINRLRRDRGLPALTLDPCLNREAETATSDWLRTREPHGYFERTCTPLLPKCACGWSEENQSFVEHQGQSWQDALQRVITEELQTRPNDRFANNIFSQNLERVGIGIIVGDQKLWVTNAFGDAGFQLSKSP